MAARHISNPWIDDPISTLVTQRFPVVLAYLIGNADASAEPPEEFDAKRSRYRAELSALTEAQLAERVAEGQRLQREAKTRVLEQAESQRFFNQAEAAMDVAHWSKMSYWTLDEALALSFGKEPRIVTWLSVQREIPNSPFAKIFSERRQIIARAKSAGQLFDTTHPGPFLAWARRMQIPVPETLLQAVDAIGVQVRDWKSAYDEQQAFLNDVSGQLTESRSGQLQLLNDHAKYIDKLASGYTEIIDKQIASASADKAEIRSLQHQIVALETAPVAPALPTEKSLGTRERESLLKLVIGMAVKGYGFDPKAGRNGSAREIAGDLDQLGISLDEDTIRKYLTEAKALLPPSEAE